MTREQSQKANQYIKEAYNKAISVAEIAKHTKLDPKSVIKRARRMGLTHPNKNDILGRQSCSFKEADVKKTVKQLTDEARLEGKLRQADTQRQHDSRKYKAVVDDNARLKKDLDAALEIRKNIDRNNVWEIPTPKKIGLKQEATSVSLFSDLHLEERVRPEVVNRRNAYNLSIAEQSVEHYFQIVVRLIEKERQGGLTIKTHVLGLLGDYITGRLHDSSAPDIQLEATDAINKAYQWTAAGIEYLLKHGGLDRLQVVTRIGNHSRLTKKVWHSTEEGNSLENIMYRFLQTHFAKDKRVKFVIDESPFIILPIYGLNFRWQHGHHMVGGSSTGSGYAGILNPVLKGRDQLNRTEGVDVDIMGHFHQTRIVPEQGVIINGSVIGYNAYALGNRFKFERPGQVFFTVDSKYQAVTNPNVIFFPPRV